MAFLDAYNRGDLSGATALLAEDVVAGDCDYGKRESTGARGRAAVSAWLAERFNDHDRFMGLDALEFGEPNPLGEFAVGVSYVRRTSDTLRVIGFENGIEPTFAIKVILSPDGDRLTAWVPGDCPDF